MYFWIFKKNGTWPAERVLSAEFWKVLVSLFVELMIRKNSFLDGKGQGSPRSH